MYMRLHMKPGSVHRHDKLPFFSGSIISDTHSGDIEAIEGV